MVIALTMMLPFGLGFNVTEVFAEEGYSAVRIGAEDIQDGDKVIIVCTDANYPGDKTTFPALGENDKTYILPEAVSLSSDKSVATWTSEKVQVMVVTIEDDKYVFSNGSGDILKYSNTEKQVLWGKEDYANSKWVLDADDDSKTFKMVADANSQWKLQYNKSSPRFNTYKSSQCATMAFFKIPTKPVVKFAADKNGKIKDGSSEFVAADASKDVTMASNSVITVSNQNITIPDGSSTKTLTATPNENYVFDKWVSVSGDTVKNGSYTINEACTFKAVFTLQKFDIEAEMSAVDEKNDGKIDTFYLNAAVPDDGAAYGFIIGENDCATDENLRFVKDGGNPLFTKQCTKYDVVLETPVYDDSEITAVNCGGTIDDKLIAFRWDNMLTYTTLGYRVYKVLADGSYEYGPVKTVTFDDGLNLSPLAK